MTTIDVTEATFEKDVLDRSFHVPVVVDFWAEWCGPCRALSPVLEKLAAEANGDWVLAKIDVDSNQRLAAAAGVQGIPAVRAFKDGRQVAEFTGALPEDPVRAWLAKLGPSEADGAVEAGSAAELRGDLEEAEKEYERAVSLEPGHDAAKRSLTRVKVARHATGVDESDARRKLEIDPTDPNAAIALADVLAQRGEVVEAFDLLLRIVKSTIGDRRDEARAHLVELLDLLAPDDPRAIKARKELSLALF